MKKIISSLVLVGLLGCSTSQQTVTYNTIYSVESGATASVQAYFSAVSQGAVPTNGVPQVSKLFDDLQSGIVLATLAAQNNSNAIAPTNLIVEATALVNLIQQVSK